MIPILTIRPATIPIGPHFMIMWPLIEDYWTANHA